MVDCMAMSQLERNAMANTRDVMGDAACLDALLANTLTSFEDDGVTRVSQNALRGRTALTSVVLPNCTSLSTNAFYDDTALESVDIKGGGSFSSYAFHNCASLKHLVMRDSSLTSGTNNLFTSSPMRTCEGAIYVPSELVSSYRANSYWKKYMIISLSKYPLSTFESISDSWATIATKCASGDYATDYSVGDMKIIEIDGSNYLMELVAMDADVLASDGTTTVPTTWVIARRFFGRHSMNDTATTTGGWANSSMRSWLSTDVLPLLPSDVRSSIKEVRKYSNSYENDAIVKDGCVTSDKLWVPSLGERLKEISDAETNAPTYRWSETTRWPQSGYAASSWWLRSANNSTDFRTGSDNGGVSHGSAASSYGVVFGFCI